MEEINEEAMLEELKQWDEESWKRFKETQYEIINVDFKLND